jgi:hypothetical protein
VYGVRIPGYEGMPPGKILALCNQAISTASGQPAKLSNVLRFQPDTIGNQRVSLRITAAPAPLFIQIPADHPGIKDFAIVFILQLVQAAAGTTVTERFPLVYSHLLKRFAQPERSQNRSS